MQKNLNNYSYADVEKLVQEGSVLIVKHAAVADKLARLRDLNSPSWLVRQLVNETATVVALVAASDLSLRSVEIETPMCKTMAQKLENDVVLAPIMRAGLAMEEGVHRLFPTASTAHYGCFRDEITLQPNQYFCKAPALKGQELFVLDPMLATGGSMNAAIAEFKQRGFVNIKALTIISVPEGIMSVHEKYPDVKIYTCAVDDGLDENGYIIPGAGDLGDRIYGAK